MSTVLPPPLPEDPPRGKGLVKKTGAGALAVVAVLVARALAHKWPVIGEFLDALGL